MRYCFTLDLKDDAALIAEYERYHQNVWPEIIDSIKDAGITAMEIYRTGNRLFMIMETDEHFSFDKKNAMDQANLKVTEWENLMWKYQKALPNANVGEKWKMMDSIFEL